MRQVLNLVSYGILSFGFVLQAWGAGDNKIDIQIIDEKRCIQNMY